MTEQIDDALNVEPGFSEIGRRLSDKILSAFNHAYAVGETEIADMLKQALAANEALRAQNDNRRSAADPMGQAERWVAFVEARNSFRAISQTDGGDSPSAVDALEKMKEAYRLWSIS